MFLTFVGSETAGLAPLWCEAVHFTAPRAAVFVGVDPSAPKKLPLPPYAQRFDICCDARRGCLNLEGLSAVLTSIARLAGWAGRPVAYMEPWAILAGVEWAKQRETCADYVGIEGDIALEASPFAFLLSHRGAEKMLGMTKNWRWKRDFFAGSAIGQLAFMIPGLVSELLPASAGAMLDFEPAHFGDPGKLSESGAGVINCLSRPLSAYRLDPMALARRAMRAWLHAVRHPDQVGAVSSVPVSPAPPPGSKAAPSFTICSASSARAGLK